MVDLLEVSGATFQFMLDHAPSPGIGAGVPHRPGNALELGELEDRFGQGQMVRIECDRLLSLKVAVAVTKAPDLRTVGQRLHSEQRGRYRLQGAGELDVDVGFAFRSHSLRSPSWACPPALGDARLRAPFRAGQCRGPRRRPRTCRGQA